MANWCDHPASKAICQYGVPAARVYCAYCGTPEAAFTAENMLAAPKDHHGRGIYNPEIDEDPDNRPYVWDLPQGDCKCH